MRSLHPAAPRAVAVGAIALGTGLFGFAVGGVGAVDRDVAAAERQQRLEQVRQVVHDAERPCPFDRGGRDRTADPAVAGPEL